MGHNILLQKHSELKNSLCSQKTAICWKQAKDKSTTKSRYIYKSNVICRQRARHGLRSWGHRVASSGLSDSLQKEVPQVAVF